MAASAIATDLKIPQQMLLLPNGDILVAEGQHGSWNRKKPVGVLVDPAGALLIADDLANVIWRVTRVAQDSTGN